MSVPYDYDHTNIEHLRAVVAEQEATIEYLRELLKELESENAKLCELVKNALDYISHEGCGVDNPYEGSANEWCEDCSHFDSSTCSYVIVQTAKELGLVMDD